MLEVLEVKVTGLLDRDQRAKDGALGIDPTLQLALGLRASKTLPGTGLSLGPELPLDPAVA